MLTVIKSRRSCDVYITGRELARYRLDFESIDASKPETRKLLEDVFSSLKSIGMRKSGQSAAVKCSKLGSGCRLEVSVFFQAGMR